MLLTFVEENSMIIITIIVLFMSPEVLFQLEFVKEISIIIIIALLL